MLPRQRAVKRILLVARSVSYRVIDSSLSTSADELPQSRNATTLRPVTIKQVLESTQAHPDAEFKIDDVELGHVRFRSPSSHPVLSART